MDTSYLLQRASVGERIDQHGAAFLGFLTTNPAGQNLEPVERVQFVAGRFTSSVQVRIHQVDLLGQLAHRFVKKDSLATLYGAIEFRRLSDEGFPDGEPIFVLWFDDYGSYGVGGQAGYVSMTLPERPQSEALFRSKVATSLFLRVQELLLEQAVAHGT